MPISRERRDELTRQQAAISGILKNPAFAEFVAENGRKIERQENRVNRIARAPEGANQRALDYLRGFIDALQWQITMPEVAERNLLRYLRSQGVEITEEEDETYV